MSPTARPRHQPSATLSPRDKEAFHETDRPCGRSQTTTKLSLNTVDASRIVREEVFYYTPRHR
jgi:hypothetical protein